MDQGEPAYNNPNWAGIIKTIVLFIGIVWLVGVLWGRKINTAMTNAGFKQVECGIGVEQYKGDIH